MVIMESIISNGNNLLGRRKAIEELEKGREFANKLRVVINGGDGGVDGEQLVEKVLMSFTNSLLILNKNTTSSNNCDEVYDVPSSCGINPTKSEDSLESNCKSSVHKERRGCYKRRRTSQVLEKESEAPIDDGHQWRKYGQKVILNSKHPRNYYRCTHKYDQGCLATKQVQQVEDEPTLYKTTYYGNHTCRNTLNPTIILDDSNDDSPSNSSMFLSFDNSLPTKQECPIFLSSSSLVIKKEEEFKEEDLNNNNNNNHHHHNNNVPSCSSNDYMISSELTFDNYSKHHVNALSSTLDSDDVISGEFYDPSQLDDAFEHFLRY